jgi:trigger factor
MVKNLNHIFINSTTLTSQFLVDTANYSKVSSKITSDFLSNIEIPGFRKGKAPKHLAEEKLNQEYLKNSIFQEVIFENYAESESSIKQFLEKDDRKVLSIGISNKLEDFIESDEGFSFSLVTNLLPKIDLSKIEQINISEPKIEDIKNRLSLDEITAKETDGLIKMFGQYKDHAESATAASRIICDITENNITLGGKPVLDKETTINLGIGQFPSDFEIKLVGIKPQETREFKIKLDVKDDIQEFEFTVLCHKVQELETKTIDELFKSDEKMVQAFGSVISFNQAIADKYNNETKSILNNIKTRSALQAVVTQYLDTEIDEEAVKAESERIITEINKEDDPVTHFNQLNMMYTDEATIKTLGDQVTKYVRGEFISSKILLVVYFEKVEEKISDEEIKNNTIEILKNPTQYGYPANITEKVLKDQVFDRLLNYKSTQWLINNIKNN